MNLEEITKEEIRWKKNCPPSKILVASAGFGESIIALDGMGSEVEYMKDQASLSQWISHIELGPGIHVIDVRIRTFEYHTDYGYDYDEEVELIETRRATTEELLSYIGAEYIWEKSLWIEEDQ